MPAGRPPKLFTREQVEELGKDLLRWVLENPKEFMWVSWYYNKGMLRGDWEALVQRDEFLGYYETARLFITQNMILNKDVAQSYGNRYLGLYDNSLRDHEESIKDADSKRKASETKPFDLEAWNQVRSCLAKPPGKDKEDAADRTD